MPRPVQHVQNHHVADRREVHVSQLKQFHCAFHRALRHHPILSVPGQSSIIKILRPPAICSIFLPNPISSQMTVICAVSDSEGGGESQNSSSDSLTNTGTPRFAASTKKAAGDTVQNLHSMKMDCIVMRHSSPGACINLTNYVDAIILNAGDGYHEHPTQGLLDMMSIKERFGKIKNLKIAIVGDILHSRVARSNIYGLLKMGAKVAVGGPANLIPKGLEDLGVKVHHDIDTLVEWADAMNVLRIQRERIGIGVIPSIREYRKLFGINSERLKTINKDLVILHPGPMNRGVEISSDVADGDNAIILDQVLNGVAIRMSVLFLLLGSNN